MNKAVVEGRSRVSLMPHCPTPSCRLFFALIITAVAASATMTAETRRYTVEPTSISFAEVARAAATTPATTPFLQPPLLHLAPIPPIPLAPTATALPPTALAESPAPIQSFHAQDGRFSIPDTMGTVGTQHVMSALNDGFRVQDRTGRILSTMNDEVFWSSAGTSLYHYDPRVLYDAYSGRWIIVEAYRDEFRNLAGVSVAVSRTHDPTGTWDRYPFAAAPGEWIDYPMAAFTQTGITMEMSSVAPNGSAQNVIYVLDKAGVYAGGGGFSYDYIRQAGDVMTPVSVYGDTIGTAYLIERMYGANGIRILRVAQGNLITVSTVAAPQSWSEVTPLIPQLGSSVRISPEDTRITNAVLRNGAFWFSQTVFLPASQATRAAVQWWKVSQAGTLLDFGRIDDPTGTTSYCFPTIAVNGKNDALLGFSAISANAYPSAAYAVRAASDPRGTFRSPTIAKAGEGPYDDGRWGDYSATIPDPDDATFWTIQEYAAFPNDGPHWGVWWVHVPAPQALVTSKRRAARH